MEKSKKKSWIAIGGILIVVLIIVLFIIFNGKETRTSEGSNGQTVSALDCTTGNREDSLFYSTTANTVINEIRVTYKEGQLGTLFYEYKGVYHSSEVAAADGEKFHPGFNNYMGENHADHLGLDPEFATYGNKYIIHMYTDDYGEINRVNAKVFFIDADDVGEFGNYSIEQAKNYYEGKDFACDIK